MNGMSSDFRKYLFLYGGIALCVLFLAIRIWFTFQATQKAGPIIDTDVFVEMSSKPFFSTEFLEGLRPPLVPLIYKLTHCNFTAIIIIQTALSVLCWVFLAGTFSLWIRNRVVKMVAFLIMVLVGTSEPVVVWESCLISESVSVSLFAAVVGSWLIFLRRPRWRFAFMLLGLSLLWLFCRETNSWMLLLVGISCGVIAVFGKEKKYLILSISLIFAFVVSDISSNIGKRWVFPFLNVVSQRILPNAERTGYFARKGMPLSAALLEMSNTCASCRNYAYYNNPALESFRQWLYKNGKRTYMQWLLNHPATMLREPLSNIEYMVASGSLFHYGSPSSKRLLPHYISKLLFPIGYERYFSLLIVWLLVLGTGIAIGSGLWKNNLALLVAILLVLLAYPHMLIVWHGDTVGSEIGRHSLAVRIQLNLALWMMGCLLCDLLVLRWRQEKHSW